MLAAAAPTHVAVMLAQQCTLSKNTDHKKTKRGGKGNDQFIKSNYIPD